MANFTFLSRTTAYQLFSTPCLEAESILSQSPALCSISCRKALELAVKWVYSADTDIHMPYRDNLQSLIHEPSFKFALDNQTWSKLPYIIKLGNLAVHTEKTIDKAAALLALRGLFEFVQWIDYCYGTDYEERSFDENAIPAPASQAEAENMAQAAAKIQQELENQKALAKSQATRHQQEIQKQQTLLSQKDAELEQLRAQIAAMAPQLTQNKAQHQETRSFTPEDISEFKTRKLYIDIDLKSMGWSFTPPDANVAAEYPVDDMEGHIGQQGFVDYVLFGRDGLPLAVVEAKRSSKDPNIGQQQAKLYADCLERKFGRRPVIFLTNGFETYFWDDKTSPKRRVSMIFSQGDLQKILQRRSEKKDLNTIIIDDNITDRYYQKEAIRAVCGNVMTGHRKHLLVMATGTGKTRTASSLADVLSRGGYVTNILFLADRTALVKQARDDFKNYLPAMSLCNLCSNKDDKQARIVFSTYPTMLNAIDEAKNQEGQRLFTPAHFDLIIIDESHRSIFKKYKTIFDYFDAILVGLTATPKTEVDRNTYDFFEMEKDVPTYVYDYEKAVQEDHVLVPYYNYEVKTKFMEEGIKYDELSEADKERYEEDFAEDGTLPEEIGSNQLNKFVFNQDTVDMVLQDLMTRGIKVAGGDRLGKTIIFAQNKRHAEYILERFNHLYPQYKGTFAKRVICDDSYAQSIIDEFKIPDKEPVIAVSVDMMDTGIDVPQCVNLVFFKSVKSKTKFWQMIGRGTRLCQGLECVDEIEGRYTDKKRFLIFDYCGNFAYFRENENGYEGQEVKSLSELIFSKRIALIMALQDANYMAEELQKWRQELVKICCGQIQNLNRELIAVRHELQYVERYRREEAFTALGEGDKADILEHLAPLVEMEDKDEAAKGFDNIVYGLMLAFLESKKSFKTYQGRIVRIGKALSLKATIDAVKAKLPLIQAIQQTEYWGASDILAWENMRRELRDLIQFIEKTGRRIVYTDLDDMVVDSEAGNTIDKPFTFEAYTEKVNRYVNENSNMTSIYKLKNNKPLTELDYQDLERILTSELGDARDYEKAYGDTPFGLLVRKIARVDHQAAMEAFSEFINDASLNTQQIDFVKKVIAYIETNGYMNDMTALVKPPFDRPYSFMKLFDINTQRRLVDAINKVRENAVKVI